MILKCRRNCKISACVNFFLFPSQTYYVVVMASGPVAIDINERKRETNMAKGSMASRYRRKQK